MFSRFEELKREICKKDRVKFEFCTYRRWRIISRLCSVSFFHCISWYWLIRSGIHIFRDNSTDSILLWFPSASVILVYCTPIYFLEYFWASNSLQQWRDHVHNILVVTTIDDSLASHMLITMLILFSGCSVWQHKYGWNNWAKSNKRSRIAHWEFGTCSSCLRKQKTSR